MSQENVSRHERGCLFYVISWWEYLMPCGMSARIDGLVSQLRKVDIEPTIITPIFREYDTGLSSRETNNVRTLDLRWLRSLKSIPELILKLIGIAVFFVFSFVVIATEFLVKGRKRQLIVQYQDVFSAPPAILAGFLFGATIVGDDCSMRSLKNSISTFSWFQKAYETFVLIHTDFVVTSFKLDFRLIKSIRKNRDVLFVPNGIRVKPELTEVTRNPECLIFVGQFTTIDNIKALEDVLYIARRLFEKLSAWKICVVGGPAEMIRDAIRRNGSKTENISFLGRISQEKLDLLYREAIIGLLPYFRSSRHTSQRIKALEYLSNRLLVVASPSGVDGFEGLTEGLHYILANNREDMISRLEEALLNHARFAQIADAGRNFVIQNYTWEKVAEPYLNLIEQLVQQT